MTIKLTSSLIFLIAIIQLCSSQNIEFDEGGYILAPSNLIEGKKSDAKWIWDSGEPNPKNYFLHAFYQII